MAISIINNANTSRRRFTGFSRVGLVGTDGRRCEGSTAMPWSGGIAERLVIDGFGEGG
jgi:hypothetical protein